MATPPLSVNQQTTASKSKKAGFVGSLLLIVVLGAAIVFRQPLFLSDPRFWAEEGRVFFRFAYLHDFLTGLLYVPVKLTGYFLLCATLPTTIAARVPIELAPAVTTWFSLFYQVGVASLIAFGRSMAWPTLGRKVLAGLALMSVMVLTQEAWLNTINLQLFCGIATLVILTEDLHRAGTRRRFVYRIIILFNGLSGLYSVAMFPAFVLKAFLLRCSESGKLALLLGLCLLVQAGVYFAVSADLTDLKMVGRPILQSVFFAVYYQVLVPIFGLDASRTMLGPILDTGRYLRNTGEYSATIGYLSAALYVLIVSVLMRLRRDPIQTCLALAFLAVTALTIIGSVHGIPRQRYSVVPFFALCTLVISSTNSVSGNRRFPWLPAVLLLGLIPQTLYRYLHLEAAANYGPSSPRWTKEIRTWKQDPNHVLKIFPHPRWDVYLADRTRLISANSALTHLQGTVLGPGESITFENASLSGLSLETIVYSAFRLESRTAATAIGIAFLGPSGRTNLKLDTASIRRSGRDHLLRHDLPLKRHKVPPGALDSFSQSTMIEISVDPSANAKVTLVELHLSSWHRRALIYPSRRIPADAE